MNSFSRRFPLTGWMAVLFLIALARALYVQWPAFTDPYTIEYDVRKMLFWMNAYHDPDLFASCPFTQFTRYFFLPYGVSLLYYLLTFVAAPVFIGNVLGVVLYAVTAVAFFRLGCAIRNEDVGLILYIYFISIIGHFMSFTGGLARAFAYPLVVIFLIYLVRNRFSVAALVLVAQLFFYPVVFPLCFSVLVLKILLQRPAEKTWLIWLKSNAVTLVVPIILCAIIFGLRGFTKPPFIGDMLSQTEMMSSSDFQRGGIVGVFPRPSLFSWLGRTLTPYAASLFLLPLLVAFVISKESNQRSRLQTELADVGVLFAMGWVIFGLALLFYYKLYNPLRQLYYSLPIFLMVAGALTFTTMMERLNVRHWRVVLLLVVVLYQGLAHGRGRAGQGAFLLPSQLYNAELFRFVRTLPKNSLIAADPFLSADISTYSERPVFLNGTYSDMMYFHGSGAMINQRSRDYYQAIYSDCSKPVIEFCRANNIDYLIVSRKQYSSETFARGDYWYEPLNSELKSAVPAQKCFYLPRIPPERFLFQLHEHFVIKVADLPAEPCCR